jgi:hypothetical protein
MSRYARTCVLFAALFASVSLPVQQDRERTVDELYRELWRDRGRIDEFCRFVFKDTCLVRRLQVVQKKSPQSGASPLSSAKGVNLASRQPSPWHAVSIVTGSRSCEAACALISIRYLSREAPRLPLAQCSDPESCSCSYKHYGDRRGRPRRQEEVIGLRRSRPVATERRQVRGRRADD